MQWRDITQSFAMLLFFFYYYICYCQSSVTSQVFCHQPGIAKFPTSSSQYLFNLLVTDICIFNRYLYTSDEAGPRSAVGRAPDSQVRGPGFDTRSGNILSFLLPLFQEGQLSVTGESMGTKYWLTA